MLDAGDARRRRSRRSSRVGDVLDGGYRFESIPDGISVCAHGPGTVDLFVNHETSKVPFPFTCREPDRVPSESQNDFDNSQVSQLILNQRLGRRAQRLLRHPEQRRLPAVLLELPRDEEGGVRPRHPLHERGVTRLRAPAGGLVAARARAARRRAKPDSSSRSTSRTGSTTTIYGMGRHNHENSVPIPGYDDLVVLSGDDTFTSGPLSDPRTRRRRLRCDPAGPVAAVLVHRTRHRARCWHDEGELWAFVVDDRPAVNELLRLQLPASTDVDQRATSSRSRATSRRASSRRHGAQGRPTSGYPLPPTNGSWQLEICRSRDGSRHRRPAVGARVLEPAQQRVPLRPRRGHRLRQATGHGERRLHRRLGPRQHAALPTAGTVDERPRLEDGVRYETTRRS